METYLSSFFRSLLVFICFFAYLTVTLSQFSLNELEEDFNSATIVENYIDFDGDGVFDFEDDPEEDEENSENTKVSLEILLSKLLGLKNYPLLKRVVFPTVSRIGLNYYPELFKPPSLS